jgi:hypothetical protein
MREERHHIEAFDKYYTMGESRSLLSLADHCNVTERTLKRWSIAFNWQERISQRDIENGKKIMAKTDRAVVNTKADYRKDIRLALQPVKAAINSAIVEKKNPETGQMEKQLSFSVGEAKDLAIMVNSLEKLVKADLLLMGEADSHSEHSGQVAFYFGDELTKDDI